MPDDEATTILSIPKFPTEVKRDLKVIAAREGVTLRELTVRAVEEFLEDASEETDG